MNLSFKKFISTILLVAMIATSQSFSTVAVSLGTQVDVEVKKNQQKNEGKAYKYYKQLQEESTKLLMNDEEKELDANDTNPVVATNNNSESNTLTNFDMQKKYFK